MKGIDLKYIPEDLDNIKPLLPSLLSKGDALRYEQVPNHEFQPFAFDEKDVLFWPPVYILSYLYSNSSHLY